jgi:hypothetical protein
VIGQSSGESRHCRAVESQRIRHSTIEPQSSWIIPQSFCCRPARSALPPLGGPDARLSIEESILVQTIEAQAGKRGLQYSINRPLVSQIFFAGLTAR